MVQVSGLHISVFVLVCCLEDVLQQPHPTAITLIGQKGLDTSILGRVLSTICSLGDRLSFLTDTAIQVGVWSTSLSPFLMDTVSANGQFRFIFQISNMEHKAKP